MSKTSSRRNILHELFSYAFGSDQELPEIKVERKKQNE